MYSYSHIVIIVDSRKIDRLYTKWVHDVPISKKIIDYLLFLKVIINI